MGSGDAEEAMLAMDYAEAMGEELRLKAEAGAKAKVKVEELRVKAKRESMQEQRWTGRAVPRRARDED